MTYFNNMRCHSLVNLMANFFCGGHEGAFFIKEAFLEEAKMARGLFGGGQNDRRPFLREDNLEYDLIQALYPPTKVYSFYNISSLKRTSKW